MHGPIANDPPSRCFEMDFGAQLQGGSGVRFRLWAPAAQRVSLCLEQSDGEYLAPMQAQANGWFVLDCARAHIGSCYRFLIDGDVRVPDPASRYQPDDVHGCSQVIDPDQWRWRDAGWRGRHWEEAVIYELHVGSFSAAGDYSGVLERLDYLLDLGVTAIELMPVADFPGARNWGYDGALLFAPDSRYGTPEDLKALVDAAHRKGIMVLLDVVYNHFGPDGNYLATYAPQFFTQEHATPWGAAINFDGPGSAMVRRFFVDNALYWLHEYHLDGLRLDAVHAIVDESRPSFLEQLATAIRQGPGRSRHVHLIVENDHNAARLLRRDEAGQPLYYVAQWNDDFHHAAHVLLSAESDGYYADYADRPAWHLARSLAEGFSYQGEVSDYRGDSPRGEPSAHLPPTAFVNFLQNHDQVGNRAFGERLDMLVGTAPLQALVAVLLLAPSPPLLFMGEEFAAGQVFQYFCDFDGELATAVTEGRRREFAGFQRFAQAEARAGIPDPNSPATFAASKLNWNSLSATAHARSHQLYRRLLRLRRQHILPRLHSARGRAGEYRVLAASLIEVSWRLGGGARLTLLANLDAEPAPVLASLPSAAEIIYAEPATAARSGTARLGPWAVIWSLQASADDL